MSPLSQSVLTERERRASIHRNHQSTARIRRELRAGSATPGVLREQLALASRLAAKLAALLDAEQVVQAVADDLHGTFGFYLVVVQRLDEDGILRIAAGAGPLAEVMQEFLVVEQPVAEGVNGRVARSGQPALVPDTRRDTDYIVRDAATDPRCELSVPIMVDGRVWGVLNLEEVDAHAFGRDDKVLAELVAAELGSALHRCRLYADLEHAFTATLALFSSAMGAPDQYTSTDEDEVAELAVRVAARMGLDRGQQETIRYAALLHNIGKIAIPDRILGKAGELDEHEWSIMREHTTIGADMLKRVPFFGNVHPLVRSSHERWDGAGYPDRLAATDIPIGARIVAACDALHAMTSDRPYRAAGNQEDALAELRRCAGTQFDPAVVDAVHTELTWALATNARRADGIPYVHWQVTNGDGDLIAQELGQAEPGHMTDDQLRAFEARLVVEFQQRC